MHPSRLSPASPHVTRSSPIRHGKRFGSLSVPEEHREAALRNGGDSRRLRLDEPVQLFKAKGSVFSALTPSSVCTGGEQGKEGAVPTLSRAVSMPGDISSEEP